MFLILSVQTASVEARGRGRCEGGGGPLANVSPLRLFSGAVAQIGLIREKEHIKGANGGGIGRRTSSRQVPTNYVNAPPVSEPDATRGSPSPTLCALMSLNCFPCRFTYEIALCSPRRGVVSVRRCERPTRDYKRQSFVLDL